MRAFGLLRLVLVILGSFACIFIIPMNGFGQSCSLSVTPNSGFAPLSVSATGTCNGGLTPSTMDWGDGTQADSFPPNSGTATLNHTYTSVNTFLATMTALDANGA